MAINIGDSIGGGATVGSVLFVGAGTLLAQDNFGFYFDPATNTLKSKDQSNSDRPASGLARAMSAAAARAAAER
jgi:hypothetical protein